MKSGKMGTLIELSVEGAPVSLPKFPKALYHHGNAQATFYDPATPAGYTDQGKANFTYRADFDQEGHQSSISGMQTGAPTKAGKVTPVTIGLTTKANWLRTKGAGRVELEVEGRVVNTIYYRR